MRSVLIVDDDSATRLSISMILTDEGYPTIQVTDARTALLILHKISYPHLVVLDHMMPGMKGTELLELATTDATLSRHAYALISAMPEKCLPPSLLHLRQSLKMRLLAKPFSLEDLVLTMNLLKGLLQIAAS